MDKDKFITTTNLDEYDAGLKDQIDKRFATKEELKNSSVQSTISLPYFTDPTI